MDFWPAFDRRRLIDVPNGSLVMFEYQSINYLAIVVESMRSGDVSSLVCVHPKHPAAESAGLLSASAIGGGGSEVLVIPETRAAIRNPIASLTYDPGYIAAGSLSFQQGELSVVAYVDNRSKGAFSLQNGRHLGEAALADYFENWQIEAFDGQKYVVMADLNARPRG